MEEHTVLEHLGNLGVILLAALLSHQYITCF